MLTRSDYVILVSVLVVLVIFIMYHRRQVKETMAPLDFGSFPNNYPRGRCEKGSLKRSPCMVGNCPIGTSITDPEYCAIDCAQISDPITKRVCNEGCLNLMKQCNEPQTQPVRRD